MAQVQDVRVTIGSTNGRSVHADLDFEVAFSPREQATNLGFKLTIDLEPMRQQLPSGLRPKQWQQEEVVRPGDKGNVRMRRRIPLVGDLPQNGSRPIPMKLAPDLRVLHGDYQALAEFGVQINANYANVLELLQTDSCPSFLSAVQRVMGEGAQQNVRVQFKTVYGPKAATAQVALNGRGLEVVLVPDDLQRNGHNGQHGHSNGHKNGLGQTTQARGGGFSESFRDGAFGGSDGVSATPLTPQYDLQDPNSALLEARKTIDAVIQTAPVGICVTDSDGKFVDINDAYTSIYGYTKEELLGEHFTKVVFPDQNDFWKKKHKDFIQGADETRGEFRVRHKDGHELTILTDSTRITGADGRPQKVTYVIDITERKEQEAKLQFSEQRLQTMVQTAPVGICVTNDEGRFEQVNETYLQIYKYTEEELIGKSFTKVVKPEDKSFWLKKHDDFLAGADETRGEFTVLDKHGKELTILADSARIYGDDGKPRKVTYVIDITERKRQEAQIYFAGERLKTMVDAAPVGICVTNEAGNFEQVNSTYLDIYGFSEQELIGKPFTVVTKPEDTDFWHKKHRDFIAGEDETRGEFNVLAKDGRELTILADSARIIGEDGGVKKVTYVIDITERKRQEAEIQLAGDRLQTMVDAAPVGICVTNENCEFEQVNSTYTLIYGYEPEELIGQSFTKVVKPEDRNFWIKKHDDFINGADETRGEFNVLAKDGRELTILADSARIIGRDGRPKKVTYVIDITERKRQEAELRRSEERLKTLVDSAPVGICITGPNATFEAVNAAYTQIYGYSEAELLGQPFTLVTPTKDHAFWLKKHEDFLAGKDETRGEFNVISKGGKMLTILADSARIVDADGQTKKVTYVLDITERKKAESLVQQSEERTRKIIETAPVAVAILDESGNIEQVNDALELTLGKSSSELIGSGFSELLKGTQANGFEQRHGIFMQGEESERSEMTLVSAEGEDVFMMAESSKIVSSDGNIRRILFLVDITKRKQDDQRLRDAYQQLRASEEELRQNAEEMQATQDQMRQQQIQLKRSEAIARSIIETAPIGICVTDKDGKFVQVNDTYSAIYNYTPQEFVGQHFTMVVPENEHDSWKQAHDEVHDGYCLPLRPFQPLLQQKVLIMKKEALLASASRTLQTLMRSRRTSGTLSLILLEVFSEIASAYFLLNTNVVRQLFGVSRDAPILTLELGRGNWFGSCI